MEIKKVVVVGAGTMGGQIGFQCAVSGFNTVMVDLEQKVLEDCRRRQLRYANMFVAKMGYQRENIDAAVVDQIPRYLDKAEAESPRGPPGAATITAAS